MQHYRKVCLLDNDILLAAIIENANQLGVHSKKPMTPPKRAALRGPEHPDRADGVYGKEQDFLGEVDYLMSHSRHLDKLLFPMRMVRKLRVMAVVVDRPYDYEDIVEKFQNHLNGMKD